MDNDYFASNLVSLVLVWVLWIPTLFAIVGRSADRARTLRLRLLFQPISREATLAKIRDHRHRKALCPRCSLPSLTLQVIFLLRPRYSAADNAPLPESALEKASLASFFMRSI